MSARRARVLTLLRRRQDLRHVKAGAIERLHLPDVQKAILETIRQAPSPPPPTLPPYLPPCGLFERVGVCCVCGVCGVMAVG